MDYRDDGCIKVKDVFVSSWGVKKGEPVDNDTLLPFSSFLSP